MSTDSDFIRPRGSKSANASAAAHLKQARDRVAALQRYAHACSTLLYKQGVPLKADPYACGSFGCVYPAGPGRVAKLSFDVGEAELAILFARSRGAHAALPLIYYVGRLPNDCGTWRDELARTKRKPPAQPVFVVVREDLEDVSRYIEPDAKKRRLDIELQKIGIDDPHGFGNQVDRAVYLLKPFPNALRFYQQAVDFALWSYERDVHLADTHIANWGVRGGRQIVLRDFGLSSSEHSPGARSIPALHGLSGLFSARPRLVIRGLRGR